MPGQHRIVIDLSVLGVFLLRQLFEFLPLWVQLDHLPNTCIDNVCLVKFRCYTKHPCTITAILLKTIICISTGFQTLTILTADYLKNFTEMPMSVFVNNSINRGCFSLLPNL